MIGARTRSWFAGLAAGIAIVSSACIADEEGIPRAAGFDGETITLGVITTVDGVMAPVGQAITAGNRLYWDELNAHDGVAGRYPVELRVADARNFESVAVVEYDAMVEEIVLLNQIQYTRSIRAILPRLKMQVVVALPASPDADWIREPNLLPVAAPSDIQAINGAAHHVAVQGAGARLCSLWEDDTYGRWGSAALDFAVAQLGLTLVARSTFGPIEQNFASGLDELQAAGCEAVVLSGLPFHTLAALRQAQSRNYAPQWIVLARGWQADFAEDESLAPYLAANVWVVAEGPAWGDESAPGMKQMLDALERHMPEQKPDLWFAYGYAQSWLAHRVLEEAVARGDLSRSGIFSASQSLGTVDFGGLVGAYTYGDGPDQRDPPRASTLFAVDPTAPGGLTLIAQIQSEVAIRFSFEK